MLKKNDMKRAIQSIDALGSTPAVLVRLNELAKDPNTDLETICGLLQNDGPLVADFIRISNSPYYTPASFHSNLPSAINYIGLRAVNRVVSLSLARQLFARDLTSYGISAFEYWSDSVATALVMEALARQSGQNADDAYTVGILHAIGRVVINCVITREGFSLFWDGLEPIQTWELNAVGFDFAEAGALLLEHWRFPAATREIIRCQLTPVETGKETSLLGSLQFTRRIIALTGSDFGRESWQLPDSDSFMLASGLTSESLANLISVCQVKFQTILQSVDLK